jgi:DMATS type aromatic prenyltransferase
VQSSEHDAIKGAERSRVAGTLVDFCEGKLAAVCERTSFARCKREILDVYRDLSSSWGTRRVDERPAWSGLTCDLTPFEISIAVSPAGDDELRFIVEPQGVPPCPATYWAQTRALFEVLECKWGIDVARLRRVEDLIEPTIGTEPAEDEGGSCTGYGVVFQGRQRGFKFWFNPDCKGVSETATVCRELMGRLSLADAWRWTSERLPETTSLLFGLELSDEPAARVQLYIRIKDPNLENIEKVASLAMRYVPGDLAAFWSSLRWNNFPVMRPHLVALHFVAGAPLPVSCALQFATYPFLPNDALVRRCVRASLQHYGISPHLYDETLGALAGHCDLESESLLHSWVSFQRDKHGGPRLAVYFPGRAYFRSFGALGINPRVQWPYPEP